MKTKISLAAAIVLVAVCCLAQFNTNHVQSITNGMTFSNATISASASHGVAFSNATITANSTYGQAFSNTPPQRVGIVAPYQLNSVWITNVESYLRGLYLPTNSSILFPTYFTNSTKSALEVDTYNGYSLWVFGTNTPMDALNHFAYASSAVQGAPAWPTTNLQWIANAGYSSNNPITLPSFTYTTNYP